MLESPLTKVVVAAAAGVVVAGLWAFWAISDVFRDARTPTDA